MMEGREEGRKEGRMGGRKEGRKEYSYQKDERAKRGNFITRRFFLPIESVSRSLILYTSLHLYTFLHL